jgi:hypothetical protein
MIVSIHMPKAAGTSFGEALRAQFGKRLLHDYGDGAEFNLPEAIAHRTARMAQVRARRDEILSGYDAIHGHFIADKYIDLFPETRFITFLCDPHQQAISDYAYFSTFHRRYPGARHSIVEMFDQANMSFTEFLAWDVIRNPQSQLLGELALDALAVVGIREQFPRGVALVNRRLGLNLSSDVHVNSAFDPSREWVGRDDGWRRAVEKYRDRDIALYRLAKERFERDAGAAGL